jgi:hypothetical protein
LLPPFSPRQLDSFEPFRFLLSFAFDAISPLAAASSIAVDYFHAAILLFSMMTLFHFRLRFHYFLSQHSHLGFIITITPSPCRHHHSSTRQPAPHMKR